MRVLVFDVSHHGHRTQYVHQIIRAVADLPVDVTLAMGAEALGSPQFDTYLAPLSEHFEFLTLPPLTLEAGWKRSGGTVRQLRRTVRELRPDHVLMPYVDGAIQIAGLQTAAGRRTIPRGIEAEGLTMRGRHVYESPRTLKARARTAASRWAMSRAPFTWLHHLDPFSYEYVRHRGGALAARSSLIPEPVEPASGLSKQEARRVLGVTDEGRILGSVGTLDTRKGTELLINAFLQARLPDSDRLLLAGLVRPGLRTLLAGPLKSHVESGRIIVLDRFLSESDFLTAIAAADVIAVPYPRHIGSSGIVVRAPSAGRPVLGSDFGWIGSVVKRFGLGEVVDVRDDGAFADSIGTSLDSASSFELGEAARRFRSFHTAGNFRLAWSRRIRARLGLPPAEGAVDWSWVIEAASGE